VRGREASGGDVIDSYFENIPQAEKPERSSQRKDTPSPKGMLDSLTVGATSGLYLRLSREVGRI
jgi:hypothetical protein